jgi:hypothetical protein
MHWIDFGLQISAARCPKFLATRAWLLVNFVFDFAIENLVAGYCCSISDFWQLGVHC